MKKFFKKHMKNEKGMTLIELLAVIVIIAIIAAIAIPAIGNIIENSRYSAIKADASNIMGAADIFYAEGKSGSDATKVTVVELRTAGYLEDTGSFNEDATTFVTKPVPATTTPAKISGVSEVGNVKLTFSSASRDDIEKLSKDSPKTGTIKVTGAQ